MSHYKGFVLLLLFYIAIHQTRACDRCVHKSKASFFSTDSPLTVGACGYKSLALSFNGGYIAAARPSLFRNGVGCGACFQIRCMDTKLCSNGGVVAVVTDLNTSNETDFVLSSRAFMGMAKNGSAANLYKVGIVDVEYKRVPCEYHGKNLSIRVEENSKNPNYLAIKMLYQGGQTDIVGVDVARVNQVKRFSSGSGSGSSSGLRGSGAIQFGPTDWRFMTRDYGPVWTTSHVPSGPLQFRLVVTSGYDGKWVWAQREVLPVDWKTSSIYDLGVQISDIAQEGCPVCDRDDWK